MAKKDKSLLPLVIFKNDSLYFKKMRMRAPDYSGVQPVRHSKLSAAHRKLLDDIEQYIGESKGSFDSVMRQFMIIKAMNLYREEYDTFEDYCRVKYRFKIEDLTNQDPKGKRKRKK
jgi:hypothetical protein